MKRALAIALLLLVASGATALALAEPPTQEPADSAEAARRATVYARFGDVTVTVGQIEDRLAAQTTFRRDRYADPERLREAADAIVDGALLAAEAERRGYAERPTVKRAYREALVQRFIREEFDEPFRVAEVSDA
ncbi:MAG: hypothetical protein H5U40_00415, partial [Polyangiaceae bacterium]|nr:hypothetical protein [Polyangiaceae bacterium]